MITEPLYRRCGPFARFAGRLVMKLGGWKVSGAPPNVPRMVVIAAPHTSNWDLIYMLAAAYTLGFSLNWLGKDSLFRSPLGPVLRYFGGMPVDRSKSNQLTTQLARDMNARPTCALAVPPEGTRGFTDHWKSGFYWIAHEAQVPVLLSFLDWKTRQCGVGPSFIPTGDVSADMDRIRKFYAGMQGRFPERTSTIRLRDEDSHLQAPTGTDP